MRRRVLLVAPAFMVPAFAACSQILGDVPDVSIDGGDAALIEAGGAETSVMDASPLVDASVDATVSDAANGSTDVGAADSTFADTGSDSDGAGDAALVDARCSQGATRCDATGALQQVCQGDGGWEDRPCGAFCVNGSCVTPPSCSGTEVTTDCGPDGGQSCCAARTVPGGTFYRSYDGVTDNGLQYDAGYPATISPFALDSFEVTVSRFRNFVNAYDNWTKPASGDGRNPNDPTDKGWGPAWATHLQASAAALKSELACTQYGFQGTWTDSVGPHEPLPVTCIDWYMAFAFCVWDGGRLATEAEWNFAASGGSDQRVYPWSPTAGDQTIDSADAVYLADAALPVGSKPAGLGKWGHSDLAGNAEEWVRDWYADPYPSSSCVNCANLTASDFVTLRGGNFDALPDYVSASFRNYAPAETPGVFYGIRCARSPTTSSLPGDE